MLDQIGTAHITQGNLTTFAFDRFCNANSSLALNGGWAQIPSGIYFDSPEFTISVWVYPQQIGVWSRVIDMGNGINTDSIFISFDSGSSNGIPMFSLSKPGLYRAKSIKPLAKNKWQHLASTFDGEQMRFYIDGILSANLTDKNITTWSNYRTSNFIGKSNWPWDGYSMSYVDELRFYNKCLTQEEIYGSISNETSK
jgi:hypothetical protein